MLGHKAYQRLGPEHEMEATFCQFESLYIDTDMFDAGKVSGTQAPADQHGLRVLLDPGPIAKGDEPDPHDLYGRTKILGEVVNGDDLPLVDPSENIVAGVQDDKGVCGMTIEILEDSGRLCGKK